MFKIKIAKPRKIHGAIAIIFNKDQSKILLVKRRDVPIWVLPGGGIEQDETPKEAVSREAQEETGYCQIKVTRKIGIYTPINNLTNRTHVYECQLISGKPQVNNEVKEIKFFEINNPPKLFLLNHQEWIQDALKKSDKVIKRKIKTITYKEILKQFFRHPLLVTRFFLTKLGVRINT